MGEMLDFLPEVRRVFRVEFTEAEYYSCRTPRQMVDLICSKMHIEAATSCQSQQGFYVLRSVLASTYGARRERITPSALIASLVFPAEGRQWQALRDAVGARVWPKIHGTDGLARMICVGVAGIGLWGVVGECREPHDAVHIMSMLGFLFLALLPGAWSAVFYHLTYPECTLAWRSATVKDLVPYAATSDRLQWTRERVALTLKLMVLEKFAVPKIVYTEDARFAEDFKME